MLKINWVRFMRLDKCKPDKHHRYIKHCFFKFQWVIGNFGAIDAEFRVRDPISVANCRGHCVYYL